MSVTRVNTVFRARDGHVANERREKGKHQDGHIRKRKRKRPSRLRGRKAARKAGVYGKEADEDEQNKALSANKMPGKRDALLPGVHNGYIRST